MSRTVIITGATGFIGRALSRRLLETGYEVVALSRTPSKAREVLGEGITMAEWKGVSTEGWEKYAEGAYAVVNLAGESISSRRWTQAKKRRILNSRLDAGKSVVKAVSEVQMKPKVVVQASGIGYYGSRADDILDESSPPGEGFLSEVAQKWELCTKDVERFGIRQVIIRTGIVLGSDGGALPRLLTPFRLFVGGPLGSGKQWFPWIHVTDEVEAIRFLMEQEDLSGPFNLCSPEPVTMKNFCRTLGKVMKRPSWFSVPALLLRLLFGQMANEVLLTGQRAMPKRLLGAGFEFKYLQAESALKEILG